MVTVTTTFESGGDCHHHFQKRVNPFHIKNTIFPYTLGKRIVFFLLPEAFCGLKYAENSIAVGAPPRTPMGELTTLPQTFQSAGERTPSPYPTSLQRLDHRAP